MATKLTIFEQTPVYPKKLLIEKKITFKSTSLKQQGTTLENGSTTENRSTYFFFISEHKTQKVISLDFILLKIPKIRETQQMH